MNKITKKYVSVRNRKIYEEIKETIKEQFYRLEQIANNQKEELLTSRNDIEKSNKLNEIIDTQKLAERLKKILNNIDNNVEYKRKCKYFINILLMEQVIVEKYVKEVEKLLKKYNINENDTKEYEKLKQELENLIE